MDKKENM